MVAFILFVCENADNWLAEANSHYLRLNHLTGLGTAAHSKSKELSAIWGYFRLGVITLDSLFGRNSSTSGCLLYARFRRCLNTSLPFFLWFILDLSAWLLWREK